MRRRGHGDDSSGSWSGPDSGRRKGSKNQFSIPSIIVLAILSLLAWHGLKSPVSDAGNRIEGGGGGSLRRGGGNMQNNYIDKNIDKGDRLAGRGRDEGPAIDTGRGVVTRPPPPLLPPPPPRTPPPPPTTTTPKSLLLFTMDSIKTYSQSASKGGPAGEIIIRKSLTTTLSSLYPNLRISVASSDSEMETLGSLSKFDIYVFDPWTWAGPGWKLRPFITDPSKLFILDFFGSERSYIDKNGGIRGFDKVRTPASLCGLR